MMTFQKEEAIALFLATLMLIWFSWKPLREPGGHGTYRFLAWEAIAILVIINWRASYMSPYTPMDFLSRTLYLIGLTLALVGYFTLRKYGQATQSREAYGLYNWEKSTKLVNIGIYSLIRHPMYSALLLVTWAAYTSAPSLPGLFPAICSTLMLWITAKKDEMECAARFGSHWQDYARRTHMFIPWTL